jgi:signal transduction histidine kinase
VQIGHAGVKVHVQIDGDAQPLPPGADLSAYRIIQEALTNVVRHAGTGAACTVSLSYAAAELTLRVTDDGGGTGGGGTGGGGTGGPTSGIGVVGTGHGLIGMRERVHLCGGTFSAGALPGGGFAVTASLPLPAVVPAAAVPESGAPPLTGGAAAVEADHAGDRA